MSNPGSARISGRLGKSPACLRARSILFVMHRRYVLHRKQVSGSVLRPSVCGPVSAAQCLRPSVCGPVFCFPRAAVLQDAMISRGNASGGMLRFATTATPLILAFGPFLGFNQPRAPPVSPGGPAVFTDWSVRFCLTLRVLFTLTLRARPDPAPDPAALKRPLKRPLRPTSRPRTAPVYSRPSSPPGCRRRSGLAAPWRSIRPAAPPRRPARQDRWGWQAWR